MSKILMINVPLSGHTNPTLPLAKELVKRGHTVDYINAPEWKEKIEATGANFIPYINYPKGLSDKEAQKRCFKAVYDTAIKVGNGYDVLIYEMFFSIGKILADRLNIPCIRQFSTVAINQQVVDYMRESTPLGKITYKMLNTQPFHRKLIKEMNIENKGFLDFVVSETPDLDIVYINSGFQPIRESFGDSVIFVGPSLSNAIKSEISIPYKKMKNTIIYISLGSIMSSKMFCKKCIKAFENKDVSVILTTGKVDPKSLGHLPSNIYAYNFVPQIEVLQHADLFITHAGMNSVNEAMYYGVPMLVMPIVNDQFANAQQVVKLEMGKKLGIITSTAKAIYNTAMEILSNDKIEENSLKMREHIKSDVGVIGAAEKIELLLEDFQGEEKTAFDIIGNK